MYDIGVAEKEELHLGLRDVRRRDGVNDTDERGRRVGSGRIITNRTDRERGLSGDDHGIIDRTRADRMREQNPMNRNIYESRDRDLTERRGMPPMDRRDIGRDDGRDIQNRTRFGFQRERDIDNPRDRIRRDVEPNDPEYDRARGRDLRGGDWNDLKTNEFEQRRERIPNSQQSYQGMDRHHTRNDKREDRVIEPEREQRFNKFQYTDQGNYNQRFQNSGYGRRDRGGGRYPRRSETEEPEWMSESVQMGELMELRGFDDSPEKEVYSHSSSLGNY